VADGEHPTNRLRIVHLVSSLHVGGMEHFVVRLAAEQRLQGHDARVLALQDGQLREEAQRLGLPVTVLGGRSAALRVARGLAYMASVRPQISHAHNTTSLHYAVIGRLAAGARVVLTYHGQGKGDARTPSAMEWRKTSAIIAVSQAVTSRIESSAPGVAYSVIRNGVHLAAVRRPRAELRAELGLGDALTGIIVARMDRLKGHDTLLRAQALLAERCIPLTMLIAGDGAERATFESLAHELRLGPEQVRFLGFRSDVTELLAASDFFCLPSVTEGLPLSMLEAMAHRLPVIATPVGGIPELIEEGRHGLFVPVGDAQALAEAITRIASDPALRAAFGEAGYRHVEENFTFDTMTGRYEELYRRLLAGKGSS